jgi:CRISPR-associated protein Csm2
MSLLSNWPEFSQKKNFREIPIASFAKTGNWVDNFMKVHHKEIKINQLRNFFGEIQTFKKNPDVWQNEQELHNAIAILEMNLAYDYGRNVITKDFYKTIIEALKKVHNKEDFNKFFTFIQSLIAYHKFHTAESKSWEE